jgi:hypothetical protein
MIKTSKRFYFKQDNTYFGVIYCIGSPLILSTEDMEEANLYYEHEVEYITGILLKNKIFADPIEINFYGNYKPSRDNICNPEV